MSNTETKIIIAGFGGQGVVLTGSVIARAAMVQGKNVAGMVSYGAEMRGGTANAAVIISSKEIASPVIETPDVAIILNQPSLDKFENIMAPNATIILNTSLISRPIRRTDLNEAHINATAIAQELGNVRVANIVALGAFVKATNLVTLESTARAIEDLFAGKKAEMIEINKNALQLGFQKTENIVQTRD